jgi:hypothetical protein
MSSVTAGAPAVTVLYQSPAERGCDVTATAANAATRAHQFTPNDGKACGLVQTDPAGKKRHALWRLIQRIVRQHASTEEHAIEGENTW